MQHSKHQRPILETQVQRHWPQLAVVSLWRKPILNAVLVGLCAGLFSAEAQSDRHCAAGLEHYYAARQQAIQFKLADDPSNCSVLFNDVVDFFEEAISEASICSCQSLQSELEATLDKLKNIYAKSETDSAACNEMMKAVLDAKDNLDKVLQQCH